MTAVGESKSARRDAAKSDDREPGVLTRPYRHLTLGIVSVVLLIAFEAMAVGTAMPVAVKELHGVPLYALAFSAFFTSSLLAMVLSGEWCDARGPRLPLFGGIGTFAAGLVLAGTAQSMWPFVVGRAVQGLGGGLVIVSLYVVVGKAYPSTLRPRVFSAFSAAWVLPSIVGPPVSGLVTDHLGWRWVFLAIPVLVVLPIVMMLPQLERMTGERDPDARMNRRRLGAAGGASVGAGMLQYGGLNLDAVGIPLAVAGFALMAVTVPRLLPRGTLRAGRGLPAVILSRGVLAGAFFAVESFVPLMLTSEHGLSPTQAGLTLTVGALSWAIGSWYQGRSPRERRPGLVRIGFLLVAVAIGGALLALVPGMSPYTVTVGWFFGGLGMGLAVSSVSVLTLDLSTPEESGTNSSSLQVADTLGNIVMVGLAGAIFAALHEGTGRDAGVFTLIFAIMLVTALLGAVLAPRVRPPHPKS
ncbi:MFS transporter [Embleya scabrispora]|uniref:MFS transporter n=1 Tax=Embleya scabrispora TaxID=159449 RepID=A0A1T3P0X8_9ACTN|nr:MFS transporter [Embleya scabrispora]OPC82757.1 MFS transporter [Embleya scabrispora]